MLSRSNPIALMSRIPEELLRTAPIDIESIAERFGVTNITRAKIDCSGMLHPLGRDTFAILLNADHPRERQRFTCAHEVAHILLGRYHQSLSGNNRPTLTGGDLESACDRLASEILMPRLLFEEQASSASWQLSSVRSLASMFQTSIEATAKTYVETIGEACTLFTWKMDSRGDGLKLCGFQKNRQMGRSFLEMDSSVRRSNIIAMESPKLGWDPPARYERVRIYRSGQTSFDTIYTETLVYGSGPRRRVMNAVYPERQRNRAPKRQWTHSVDRPASSTRTGGFSLDQQQRGPSNGNAHRHEEVTRVSTWGV